METNAFFYKTKVSARQMPDVEGCKSALPLCIGNINKFL